MREGNVHVVRVLTAAVVMLAALTVASAQTPTVGLFLNTDASYDGYTLFPPNSSLSTFLIDNHGKLVQSWASGYRPGQSAYLLANGDLLRTAQWAPASVTRFRVGGQGGRVERFNWDGDLLWGFDYSTAEHRQHHDIERLPNGNVLLVAWEYKSYAEAIAAGRSPSMISQGELWPDHVIEVAPLGGSGGSIVWEWHAWDHLIQDYDAGKPNYGVVADHPELIDLNFSANTGPPASGADWLHMNAVDYNEVYDQIVLSVHNFSEIWVVDHSTTTAEAAGHSGGNSGKGGDLLYRWGNPRAYDRGDTSDQQLFVQHDSQWIPTGLPGEANILIFNNGGGRPGGNYSTVDEIVPPVEEGPGYGYALEPGEAYGPAAPSWTYTADPPTSFYASNTSGAQRLPNGNTLVCSGPQGTFFEVTPAMATVWRYVNPIRATGATQQGSPISQNGVFRATRHAPDDPAFAGRDLTPGDPLELYDRPLPVPDGRDATDPLTCSKITPDGGSLQIEWDADFCQASDYNLLYGDLANVAEHTLEGSACSIGVFGRHDWTDAPPGDLFFVIVGVDDTGLYESSWGEGSGGEERHGGTASWQCGVTTQDFVESCP